MKKIKDKKILVGADFAGYPLKEAVCEHLRNKGWEITDMGVKADSDPNDTDLMFHRVGLRAGSMIAEGEFERALLFCGTGINFKYHQTQCTCNQEKNYGNRTTHTHVLTVQVIVQPHNKRHGRTHGITGCIGENLRYIKHLQTADQRGNHNIYQNGTK